MASIIFQSIFLKCSLILNEYKEIIIDISLSVVQRTDTKFSSF